MKRVIAGDVYLSTGLAAAKIGVRQGAMRRLGRMWLQDKSPYSIVVRTFVDPRNGYFWFYEEDMCRIKDYLQSLVLRNRT
ncbi:MAG: hypothetical protein AAB634_00875 [Patescibacteria group bacterium]